MRKAKVLVYRIIVNSNPRVFRYGEIVDEQLLGKKQFDDLIDKKQIEVIAEEKKVVQEASNDDSIDKKQSEVIVEKPSKRKS